MLKNKKLQFYCILMYIFTPLIASQEPQQDIISKIDSWASICSHSSWEDLQKDCLVFKSLLEQIQYLAEKNSFFEEEIDSDEDSDSQDDSDDDSNSSVHNFNEDEEKASD